MRVVSQTSCGKGTDFCCEQTACPPTYLGLSQVELSTLPPPKKKHRGV